MRIHAETASRATAGAVPGPLLKALLQAAADAGWQGAVCCAAILDPVADRTMLATTLVVFHTDGSADPDNDAPEALPAW